MKKLINAIIVLLILIIIISILLVINKNNTKNMINYDEMEFSEEEYIENLVDERQMTKLTDRSEFYTVNACVQIYYSSIQRQNNDSVLEKQQFNTIIYNLLDKEYLKEKDITIENVLESTISMTYENRYIPRQIYVIKEIANISIYYINGRIVTTEDITKVSNMEYIMQGIDMNTIAILDKKNMTFSIIPNVTYSINEASKNFVTYEVEQIPKNDNNTFKENYISRESMAIKYLSDYTTNAIYDVETMYNLLAEEYKQKRFGAFENFKQYVMENKEGIQSITLDKYQITDEDGYTQYVCIDTNGNYYIFRETAVMQYTLLLDTYTVTIPEFKEKYDNANNMQKGAYNIEKIVEAINNRDYKYVYEKLDDTFKVNNFPTLEGFEKNIEFIFFDRNAVTYDNYEENNDIGIYTVTFKDYYQEIESESTKKIFMKLKDDYDFVFSFSV